MQAQFDPVTLAYHELRSPLGLMLTAAQSAVDECEDVVVRRRCEVIARTAERMLRTAQEMLRQAAVEREEEQLFLPAQVLALAVGDLVELGVDLALDVCPNAEAARCSGAPATFEALVQSLLSNARDHAPRGTCVRVSLRRQGVSLVLEVSNEMAEVDRHEGLGAGRLIEARLASELGARLESGGDGGTFRARVALVTSRA